jgi:putative two-component system response regulator
VEKPLVLLADDNDATCTLVRALLQNDYNLEIASDGVEAIEHLKKRRYAAILLDLLMPNVNGFDVLAFLREEQPETLPRVAILTAAVDGKQMDRLREFPVHGVIRKPFEIDTLQDAVRRCARLDDPLTRGASIFGSAMLLLLAEMLVGP